MSKVSHGIIFEHYYFFYFLNNDAILISVSAVLLYSFQKSVLLKLCHTCALYKHNYGFFLFLHLSNPTLNKSMLILFSVRLLGFAISSPLLGLC